jgi:hypothetical protein
VKSPEHQNSELTPANVGRLIVLCLKARLSQGTSSASVTPHPNEDLINAFVEGQLSEAESHYLVSHLVECATCLHLTAELIRHEPVTHEINSLSPIEEQPGPLQRFIDSLVNGVPTLNEDAVFAYQEKEETDPSEDNANSDIDR